MLQQSITSQLISAPRDVVTMKEGIHLGGAFDCFLKDLIIVKEKVGADSNLILAYLTDL